MFGIFYIQSAYSMLNNTLHLEKLIKTLKENSYDFVALSDDQLYGTYQFFKLAKKYGIKPILGMTIEVVEDLYKSSFLVYVKNQEGYQNLLKLAFIKSMQDIDLKTLQQYQKGLIIISTGEDSVITNHILHQDMQLAYEDAQLFARSFESFYLGLSFDSLTLDVKVSSKLYELSEQTGIKLLPIHRTSYEKVSDKEAFEALIHIKDPKQQMNEDADYHVLTKHELQHMFSDYDFVFYQAEQVVKSIDFNLEFPSYEMPLYQTKGASGDAYLKSLAIKGLKKRLKKINTDHHIYQQRLTYELNIIHQMGYDHYFLIVFDFVRYAKTHDILVGPGRGSAAGSLVSYCLGITDVDPIKYDLLFERFLNPERVTMPDIDMDFPDNRRDEVLRYVQQKYGKNHVISIVTFNTFAIKSSMRDIARVMDIDHQRVGGMIKRVMQEDIDPSDHEIMKLLEVSKKIEGLPRQTGTHAAGMILAQQDLSLSIPLQMGSNGFYQSQFEAKDLEKLGLLKIDFLGIKNLSIIHEVITLIKQKEPDFVIQDIPLDDAKVYQLLSVSDTFGVFQLESSGMRNVLRKYEPKVFEDLIALLALFRPGPMDLIDDFIARKNGASFAYIHPDLEPILKNTYGIIVYQEQIMKIANEFAGYSLAQADILRRGISKKDADILKQERKRFVDKCMQKKYSFDVASTIYDLIVKFADYGFNRSHSVSYALVAYQMAYLKVNYYAYFMTVLLTHAIGNDTTTYEYISDLKRHQIEVLSPHINLSTNKYQLLDQGILMPFNQMKSFGRIQVEKLLEVRANKPFENYQDFKQRIRSVLNQKNIETLIYADALKVFQLNQHTLFEHRSFEETGYGKYIADYQMKMYEEYPFSVLAAHEKEALGFNLNYHPLVAYKNMIESLHLNQLKDSAKLSTIKALAFIVDIKEITTKTNQKMAFLTLDDGVTQIEATVFTRNYHQYKKMLDQEVKLFELKKNTYQNKTSFIVEKIKKVEA
ncbi:DNA polymerase III subunit alpha [Mycoplasmatota bacterium]|nr:DNA polymerase III subunit alpha [Mycoplasmatota bacterium]